MVSVPWFLLNGRLKDCVQAAPQGSRPEPHSCFRQHPVAGARCGSVQTQCKPEGSCLHPAGAPAGQGLPALCVKHCWPSGVCLRVLALEGEHDAVSRKITLANVAFATHVQPTPSSTLQVLLAGFNIGISEEDRNKQMVEAVSRRIGFKLPERHEQWVLSQQPRFNFLRGLSETVVQGSKTCTPDSSIVLLHHGSLFYEALTMCLFLNQLYTLRILCL